jgi:hypothetical protein
MADPFLPVVRDHRLDNSATSNEPSSGSVGALLTGSLDAVFLSAELPDHDSLLRQREDHAGRGDAAQYVLAKRDQRRCGFGSDRA